MKSISFIDLTQLSSKSEGGDSGAHGTSVSRPDDGPLPYPAVNLDTPIDGVFNHQRLSVRPAPPSAGDTCSQDQKASTTDLSDLSSMLTCPNQNGTSATLGDAKVKSEDEIVQILKGLQKELPELHTNSVYSALCLQQPTAETPKTGKDLFGKFFDSPRRGKNIRHSHIHTRSTFNARKRQIEMMKTVMVKSRAQAVPPYRSHIIEVPRNILAPYAPLTYVPHVRDIDNPIDQAKWDEFVLDLRQQARDSGFSKYFEGERMDRINRQEAAVIIRSVLELWLEDLKLPYINKYTLRVWHLCKTDTTAYENWQSVLGPPGIRIHLEVFASAFSKVFDVASRFKAPVNLHDILELDALDPGLYINSPEPHSETDIDKCLETHQILLCLQCFSHSCEHANFDSSFHLVQDSLSYSGGSFSDLQKNAIANRPYMELDRGTIDCAPCQNNCFMYEKQTGSPPAVSSASQMRRDYQPWTRREFDAFYAIVGTIPKTLERRPASCIASVYLQRSCSLLHYFGMRQGIFPNKPSTLTLRPKIAPILPWYDRFRKTLMGDWERQTVAHLPDKITVGSGCFHDGPCSILNCSCVQEEKFCQPSCGCTVENCSYYFTGCACHSTGRACIDKQKDRPCICLMLRRECDPALCGFCGVKELTAPENRPAMLEQTSLKSGCQNCDLQLGRVKKLVSGQSRIPGVGYGLFAAEDIAQGDFVIEYTGEKIAADEGIRRGARRGEGFGDDNEHASCSYLFTVLEGEGIWVDGAGFGNKSRYINHSKDMCNLVPRIIFVVNEHRIKFIAKRAIKTGEELLFDYGDNFPNLVDLMDRDKANRQQKSSQEQVLDDQPKSSQAYKFASSLETAEYADIYTPYKGKSRNTKRKKSNVSTQEENIFSKKVSLGFDRATATENLMDAADNGNASDVSEHSVVSPEQPMSKQGIPGVKERTGRQSKLHGINDEIQDSEYEDSEHEVSESSSGNLSELLRMSDESI
ncbi:uncharacterized protein BROUX77_003607 [Berkeleyomyces rouxiae]|uniref:uncharacterized protein n=1 Tax=Berkeleyomyces rouxiae TaxID=2035830 RepID=UPI003B7F06E4